jgi:hypothetical protein
VNATVRENIGNSVAHRLADAQLSLRAARRRIFLLMMARHLNSPCHARGLTRASILSFHFSFQGSAFGGWIAGAQNALRAVAPAVTK